MKNTEHGIQRKLGMLKLAEKLGNVSQLIIDYLILNPAHGQKRVSENLHTALISLLFLQRFTTVF